MNLICDTLNRLCPHMYSPRLDTDFIAVIGENNLSGVDVKETSVREYYTTFAAHILGTTGHMASDEVETYVSGHGYSYDAYVGKSGVEKAFKSYLHGESGTKITTYNSSGSITQEVVTEEVAPGNDVYLTIDIDLQAVAEIALEDTINDINAERSSSEELADGGAVVVLDINSGDVLSIAS